MKKIIFWEEICLKKTNKKGSSIVFLSIVLSGIVIMIVSLIFASQRVATIGYTNSILTLSFKSIMSEYNLELKDKYGLFAFQGQSSDVERKIGFYSNYSFDNRESINLQSINANVSKYSLADINIAKEQFVDYSKYALGKNLFSKLTGEEEKKTVVDNRKERVLRNEGIINTLPSRGLKDDSPLWKKISGIDNVEAAITNTEPAGVLLDQYIINMFGNYHKQIKKSTYFKGELEYIINGDFSDKKNYKECLNDIELLRNVLNIAHIMMDPTKMAKIQSASQAVTPGPLGALTQGALIELWAYTEAKNDIKLLENGKKVPFIKTDANWATDLSNIISNTNLDYIEPKVNQGLTYEGYLLVFLTQTREDIKVTRALDLIQINMKVLYDRSFLILEHNTGFDVLVRVNGKNYAYKEEY